uniref:TSA: Wollemia nobilis Ref_Wollemi_Transcript_29246_2074 transcribed RNA sequence n=1 Tax=Wollemia nobilis TaxID=56998 RepID=A0A0C9RFW6_9CONI
MASLFLYHVIGDLTVGKPELVEFPDSASVAEAIVTIRDCTECGIPVWKERPPEKSGVPESAGSRQERFVGILNALDIVAHLSTESSLNDAEAALKVPVSQIVVPNNSLLRQVAPATRLVDALEIMKQGVRRLLVQRTVGWKGMSKRFSVLYNGKWLNPSDADEVSAEEKWCCLSREDMIRFLIGYLGKLAPLPLTSIEALGAISQQPLTLDSRAPAREAVRALGHDPPAIAVVEEEDNRGCRVIGDISAFKLWKTDHVSAAWALANLTAGEFVMGVEDIVPLSACSSRDALLKLSDQGGPKNHKKPNSSLKLGNASAPRATEGNRRKPNALSTVKEEDANGSSGSAKEWKHKGNSRRFSTRTLDFVNLYFDNSATEKSMSPRPYRGRSAPLTCRPSNSLAAVMAQMLAHRATHVWVTEQREDDDYEILTGIVTYADILTAVTKPTTLPNTN